jgi:tRNA(Glu) U13 pseudouridine synthase TruD
VSGCSRTWIQLGGKALALGKTASSAESNPDDPSAGMCEPCKKKFASLHDKQRRCDVPGCQNTWTWPAAAQLEAFADQLEVAFELRRGGYATSVLRELLDARDVSRDR